MKQVGLLLLATILLASESLWTVGCSSVPADATTPNSDWLKVDAGTFSIYALPGWELHKKQGIDSYVGEFAGNGLMLDFDFGAYSNPLDEEKEPTYLVAREIIGGFKAKIVSPRKPGHGLTGIYFPKITGRNKLCLYGQNLSDAQQELALKIFRTIRFE